MLSKNQLSGCAGRKKGLKGKCMYKQKLTAVHAALNLPLT